MPCWLCDKYMYPKNIIKLNLGPNRDSNLIKNQIVVFIQNS